MPLAIVASAARAAKIVHITTDDVEFAHQSRNALPPFTVRQESTHLIATKNTTVAQRRHKCCTESANLFRQKHICNALPPLQAIRSCQWTGAATQTVP